MSSSLRPQESIKAAETLVARQMISRVLNITILVLLECRTSASLAATMLIDQAEAAAGGHFYSSDENFYLFLIFTVLALLIFVEQF